jgi:hypothetical protein
MKKAIVQASLIMVLGPLECRRSSTGVGPVVED